MKKVLLGATAAAAVSMGGAASAATVEIQLTEYASVADAIAAQNAFIGNATELAYEDFEGFCSAESFELNECVNANGTFDTAGLATGDGGNNAEAGTGGPLVTALGNMRSLADKGTGNSSIDPEERAIIRSATADDWMFGRYDADRDLSEGPNNYLDSNDNGGIRLNVPGPDTSKGMFNQLSFLLMDIDDVGEIAFQLTADESRNPISISDIVYEEFDLGLKPDDGALFLATFRFSEFVDGVTVDMRSDLGDGFGVDSMSLSAIPLPAAGWMLLAGVGALGAAARRKRKAA